MACGGFGAPDISRENRLKNPKNRFMRDPDSRVPAASQTRILIPVPVVPVPIPGKIPYCTVPVPAGTVPVPSTRYRYRYYRYWYDNSCTVLPTVRKIII